MACDRFRGGNIKFSREYLSIGGDGGSGDIDGLGDVECEFGGVIINESSSEFDSIGMVAAANAASTRFLISLP